MSKFASMTANLLARKGDALPSTMPEEALARRTLAWQRQVSSDGPPPAGRFEGFETSSRVPPSDERAAERGTFVRFRVEPPTPMQDLRTVVPEVVPLAPAEPSPVPEPVLEAVEAKAPSLPKLREIREPAHIDKPKRMFVNLSPEEYERLGIVAVKRDTTRHHLLRDALDAYLKAASREYCEDCSCIAGGPCKSDAS